MSVNGRNGRNGHDGSGSQVNENRKLVAMLAVTGSISDAQSVYLSSPGTTIEGWIDLERSLTPLRKFVLDGEEPYVTLDPSIYEPYTGVETPEGDCQEDSLPREQRNQNRVAIRKMMAGDTAAAV